MTSDEIKIALAFNSVTFLPGSFDKRLANSMSGIAQYSPDKNITERQSEWMYRLLYKYRKQIPQVYEKYKDHEHCKRLKK